MDYDAGYAIKISDKPDFKFFTYPTCHTYNISAADISERISLTIKYGR